MLRDVLLLSSILLPRGAVILSQWEARPIELDLAFFFKLDCFYLHNERQNPIVEHRPQTREAPASHRNQLRCRTLNPLLRI